MSKNMRQFNDTLRQKSLDKGNVIVQYIFNIFVFRSETERQETVKYVSVQYIDSNVSTVADVHE
jgi:hypothetical protein